MNNEILINQAQHLFVMLNTKQKELGLENRMGFDRIRIKLSHHPCQI
jgi:hypothetical protein